MMKVAVFSTKAYDQTFLEKANQKTRHILTFFEPHLKSETALLAKNYPAVCIFVHDTANAKVIEELAHFGTRLIALRCAGFNNVDLNAAKKHGITVTRVPAYSPYAVAEHAAALILALNRKITRAHARVREGNFALDGLLGFDLHGKTAGVIGTGKIGEIFSKIMSGFGCKILAYDPFKNQECVRIGVQYADLPFLYKNADIISLHCPLLPQTHHIINPHSIGQMKNGVMLINTGRGSLIDTRAVIRALKSGKIGYLGLDVYEEEAELFFEDLSDQVIQDDVFTRLLTFPNVLVTGHQAFFTENALTSIAQTTLKNITDIEKQGVCSNTVKANPAKK